MEEEVNVEVGSLQPNQPGVWQVVVDVIGAVVVTPLDVVVLSRQLHHPGVLQVSVRVYDLELEVGEDVVVVVVVNVPLNRQLKQSTHSGSSGSHVGTVS